MTKRTIRGVQNIKTLSGRSDDGTIPYKAYMKLCILEMEKFRRGKEKESAMERVRRIDQRFQDIETERHEIIAALETKGIRLQRLPSLEEPPTAAAHRTTTGPFKIRY